MSDGRHPDTVVGYWILGLEGDHLENILQNLLQWKLHHTFTCFFPESLLVESVSMPDCACKHSCEETYTWWIHVSHTMNWPVRPWPLAKRGKKKRKKYCGIEGICAVRFWRLIYLWTFTLHPSEENTLIFTHKKRHKYFIFFHRKLV